MVERIALPDESRVIKIENYPPYIQITLGEYDKELVASLWTRREAREIIKALARVVDGDE